MNTITNNLNTQNDAFKNIRLPSIFLQAFSIDNHQVKCRICDAICMLKENDILFHLMMCKGFLMHDKIVTTFQFNCLMCSFETKKSFEWKTHLFKPIHIFECSQVTKYSYDCDSCNTHFYGFKDIILEHQCKPKSLSILSELMAYVSKNFDIQHKRMLYFCSNCEHYSYDVTDLHVRKCCEDLTNSATYVCKTCLISFYGTSEKTFLNHKVSFEHTLLWCLNGKRKKHEEKKALSFSRLPIYITKYFEVNHLLRQIRCIVCHQILFSSHLCIYGHFNKCISSKEISNIDNSTPLNAAHCDVCKYNYSTQDEEMYKNWVQHVISFEHLNKTSRNKLYSYYCSDSKTIFYGTESFVNKQMLPANNKTKNSFFVSKVMNAAYRQSNSRLNFLNFSVLFSCGFCQTFKVDQSKTCCEHENIDSSQLFYCSTCLINFNVQTDYTKHLLSNEHITLKYFKPNDTSELGYLEHSFKMIKKSLSDMNENDDDSNECLSLFDQDNNDGGISVHFNNKNIEPPNEFDKSHSPLQATSEENIKVESKGKRKRKRKNYLLSNQITPTNSVTKVDSILNCMRKLSAQSQKSAFNNYLRMKFELLNEMPHAINVFSESKSFFCTICDSVFCDQCDWTKHYTELHDKINNPLVFYCAICHVYHISISTKISDHIQSIEHSVMLEFQEYMKNNSIKPITHDHVSSTPPCSIQVPKEENEVQTNQNSKKIQKNHNIYLQLNGKFSYLNLIDINYFIVYISI